MCVSWAAALCTAVKLRNQRLTILLLVWEFHIPIITSCPLLVNYCVIHFLTRYFKWVYVGLQSGLPLRMLNVLEHIILNSQGFLPQGSSFSKIEYLPCLEFAFSGTVMKNCLSIYFKWTDLCEALESIRTPTHYSTATEYEMNQCNGSSRYKNWQLQKLSS